jgi:hypothetical protein
MITILVPAGGVGQCGPIKPDVLRAGHAIGLELSGEGHIRESKMDFVFVWQYAYMLTRSFACMLISSVLLCMHVDLFTCMHVDMFTSMNVDLITCMHVDMLTCMNVDMFTCMHVDLFTVLLVTAWPELISLGIFQSHCTYIYSRCGKYSHNFPKKGRD